MCRDNLLFLPVRYLYEVLWYLAPATYQTWLPIHIDSRNFLRVDISILRRYTDVALGAIRSRYFIIRLQWRYGKCLSWNYHDIPGEFYSCRVLSANGPDQCGRRQKRSDYQPYCIARKLLGTKNPPDNRSVYPYLLYPEHFLRNFYLGRLQPVRSLLFDPLSLAPGVCDNRSWLYLE